MPFIQFAKKNREALQVETGSILMKSLLAQQIPVASSCNGDGVCGKCKINIIHGMENLSAKNETEKLLIEKNNLNANQRISCQCQVLGDIEIDTGYW